MAKKDNSGDYNMTHQQIAEILGVSQQRVAQILENAFRKLRRDFIY